MSKTFRALALLVAFSAHLFAVTTAWAAGGIVLSPPKFEFDADPGQVINESISLTNQGDTTVSLSAAVQDFVASGETGQPSFIDPAGNDPAISVSNWISVKDPAVTIDPGKKKNVNFTITVPTDAEPGGHYGAIFFSPPAGTGQVAVTQRIGALVLVRVKGQIVEHGQLDKFGIFDPSIQGEDLTAATSEYFHNSTPIDFAIRYQNEGNVHFKPSGKIEIFNSVGMQVAPVGVQSVLNEKGVEIKKEIVDYLPINNERGNVLSKSARVFRAAWQGEPYWYYLEDGTKEIRYRGWPLGFYNAKLTLVTAGGGEVTESVRFFILPWKQFVGGLAILVALGYGFIRYRRYSLARLEAEFRRRLEAEKKKK